ncbi:PHP domain-containing protein [Acinetobacter larvae]|uniref:Phosphatase n=1 Tax=Acinetobacter larvae TaxID=1789224 RepID=A0A1B2M271_9GAMM|nr:PHP domain-containing protein [Acinetobacter larvae]AOA59269.1 phosphatase [Acinetobacter larvae]
MIGVDLHTHSNISDGSYTPAQLVQAAHDKGIHTLALTDHDSMDGLVLAQQAAQDFPIKIISGVEISSQWSRPSTQKQHGVHIVALDMQQPEPLLQLLAQQKTIRADRAVEICQLLAKILAQDFYPLVLNKVDQHPDRITRSHIASVLVEQGIVKRPQQAFDHYLKEGKKAFVRFQGVDLATSIATIHASQGFAVLAHPTRYNMSATNVRFMLELFAQLGGDAVELPAKHEPPATRQMIDRLIAQHQLKVSVGSDFHGDYMPWIQLGNVPTAKAEQYGIWQDFAI